MISRALRRIPNGRTSGQGVPILKAYLLAVVALGSLLNATATAGPLNPADFASLGQLPSSNSAYVVNSSLPNPTLTGPGGSFTGVVSNGIAVFDFDSINASFSQDSLSFNPLPVALLSRGNATVSVFAKAGSEPVFGGGAGGTGGAPNASPGADGAGVGGGGGGGARSGGGGGGFGGQGGNGGMGGNAAGGGGPGGYDLLSGLRGGSGGGGSGGSILGPGSRGGNGGGGIEIGALGNIFLGTLDVSGGSGSTFVNGGGSGGASGGGLLIHGNTVTLQGSTLVAKGGAGGNGFETSRGPGGGGGGGGGGSIVILTSTGQINLISASIDVSGGAGGTVSGMGQTGTAGSPGSLTIGQFNPLVPEPSALWLTSMGLVGLLACFRKGRAPLPLARART